MAPQGVLQPNNLHRYYLSKYWLPYDAIINLEKKYL